jgi:hypothetical protein
MSKNGLDSLPQHWLASQAQFLGGAFILAGILLVRASDLRAGRPGRAAAIVVAGGDGSGGGNSIE